VSDAVQVKELLRERVEGLAAYLYPNGRRESHHWCVGDITGTPGKSFKICITGEKAGLWGDFAESGSIVAVCWIYGCRPAMWTSKRRCTKRLTGLVFA
jgi:hypothetical protein